MIVCRHVAISLTKNNISKQPRQIHTHKKREEEEEE
jgi:hypothetical protein